MAKISAGLLMYKLEDDLKVFLVHPGGPYYTKKDEGCWSIPKGEVESEDNDYLADAIREFKEETGNVPKEPYYPLGQAKQKSGKVIHIWAFEGDSLSPFTSNHFEMEWPPKSGIVGSFPEADKGEFFDLETAKQKITPGQTYFLERLQELYAKDWKNT
jgi:predicted NUDIX family NTP pyrophosphohydrolase